MRRWTAPEEEFMHHPPPHGPGRRFGGHPGAPGPPPFERERPHEILGRGLSEISGQIVELWDLMASIDQRLDHLAEMIGEAQTADRAE